MTGQGGDGPPNRELLMLHEFGIPSDLVNRVVSTSNGEIAHRAGLAVEGGPNQPLTDGLDAMLREDAPLDPTELAVRLALLNRIAAPLGATLVPYPSQAEGAKG